MASVSVISPIAEARAEKAMRVTVSSICHSPWASAPASRG